MRERSGGPSSISEILCETTNKLRMGDKLKRYSLWDRWPEIVGKDIARHARPVRWRGNVLVVRVEHPTWIQELGFLKPEILEKLRGSLKGAPIKDIRFEIGTLPPMEEQGADEKVEQKDLTTDEEEFITQASAEIPDPDIREAALRAMSKSFTHKR